MMFDGGGGGEINCAGLMERGGEKIRGTQTQ